MNIFLTAVMFFTRIPVPRQLPYSKDLLNRALRFFPLVGGVVGVIGVAILWLALLVFPFSLALLISMIATIFVTGAFHEDGFADFCDGYGGGMDKMKILAIMKDSRLGTYGTVGLVAMLATKYLSLSEMAVPHVYLVLLASHMFSRLVPVFLVYTTPYIREDALSKSKPIGNSVSRSSLVIAFVTGLISVCFMSLSFVVVLLVASVFLLVVFRHYIMKRTGGYSGDVLGALQQLTEVLFYLLVVSGL
jgi:adenosylcobinamide-GDP ribazoletransferase